MVEPKKEEQMQIIPLRKCGHFFIQELMSLEPDPSAGVARVYCVSCHINKINEICQKLGIPELKACGLFDLKKGPVNPETGKPIGEWIYNE